MDCSLSSQTWTTQRSACFVAFSGLVKGTVLTDFNVSGIAMVVFVDNKDLRGGAAALSEPNIVCCERAVGVAERKPYRIIVCELRMCDGCKVGASRTSQIKPSH